MTFPIWPCRRVGNPGKLPVIFLHGFLGSSADWLPVIRLLTDKNWTPRPALEICCYLADLPGHGENTTLPAEPLSYTLLVNQLGFLMAQLEIQRPVLVGYSLGGRVSLAAALQLPGKFNGLVLESTNPGITDEVERKTRAAWDQSMAQTILAEGMSAFLEKWYRMPLFASLANHPALFSELVQQRNANSPETLARVIAELSPGIQPSLWEELPRLDLPTLVVAGELDEKYTKISGEIHAHLARSSLQIISSAGHNAHREQPASFVVALASFLQTLGNC